MSHSFLHMPDPGQIGPFIVNLLAACRSTARLPNPSGAAANRCTLVVSPASALRQDACAVPGYEERGLETAVDEDGTEILRIDLGSLCYDQPRHVLLKTVEGHAPFSVALEVSGAPVLACASGHAIAANDAQQKVAAVQELRCTAIRSLAEACALGTQDADEMQVAAPIKEIVRQCKESAFAADASVKSLATTLEKEAVLGCTRDNFQKWGAHYFRTLGACMLKSERRSNFRDECLQHFGKDARSREAAFEELSNMAEMKFATLKPPEPSLLRPQAPVGVPIAGGTQPATAAPPPRPMALPDEFMRGGGCFGPECTVLAVPSDASSAAAAPAPRRVKVSEVAAGDLLVTGEGTLAPVACVVLTECVGGRALLTKLPNGMELTEWHPIRDAAAGGRWRFPHMLGTQVVASARFVYNFVLAPGFATVLVDGVACASLAHGLTESPVVEHAYWGTAEVLNDLMAQPGWQQGKVVLEAPTPATAATLKETSMAERPAGAAAMVAVA